jgi:hypothetical protein
MKYLKYKEFTIKNLNLSESEIHNQILSSEMISEAFENDVSWGDSLLGRLINSTIRKAKIGYNQTKIKNLLEAFKRELDNLISSSLATDTKKEFHRLLLKSYMSTLNDICTDNVPDDKKLDELLGGHQDLWNDKEQDGGKWRNIITSGYLLNFHDYVQNNLEKDELEKAGISKDAFLQSLSVFIDNLRKLTVESSTSNVNPQSHHRFASSFNKIADSLANISENISYDLLKFSEFFEAVNPKNAATQSNTIQENPTEKKEGNLKEEEKTNTTQVSSTKTSEPTKKPTIEVGKQYSYMTATGRNKGSIDNVTVVSIKEIGLGKVQVKGSKGTTFTAPVDSLKSLVNRQNITKLKELAKKCAGKEYKTSEEIFKDEIANQLINTIKSLTDEDKKYIKSKNPNLKINIGDEENKKIVDINAALDDFIEISDEKPTNKSEEKSVTNQNVEKKESQNYLYNFSDYKVFEVTNPPGTQSGDNKSEESKVEEYFNSFVQNDADKYKITQMEVDKLNDLITGKGTQNLLLNISKNPDPIIAICRVFKRANDLYFTPIIPSGRKDNKVSNKTFREYIFLGSGQNPASNGIGPWAVKVIFDKWRDGVMQILEDQKYRKILANIKFVVPGSEDTFNKKTEESIVNFSNFKKIFEAETTSNEKKSHGQILFDFINAMLDKDTAADFDTQRRTLLRKYFGNFGINQNVVETPINTTPIKPKNPSKDDIDAKSFSWQEFRGSKLDREESFYAIPIKKEKINKKDGTGTIPGHSIIFLHLIKQTTVNNKTCYFCKFTFDKQLEVEGFVASKYDGYTINNNWSVSRISKVFYGIIKEDVGGKLSIVYANVQGGNWGGNVYGGKEAFTVEGSTLKNVENVDVVLSKSKLVRYDESKTLNKVLSDFEKAINGEKNTHSANLNLENGGKKLGDALKEKADQEF